MFLSLRPGLGRKMSFIRDLVFPDRGMLYEVYPGRLFETDYMERRFHPKGIFVLSKVFVLTFLMGFLIQGKVFGERMLDPVDGHE